MRKLIYLYIVFVIIASANATESQSVVDIFIKNKCQNLTVLKLESKEEIHEVALGNFDTITTTTMSIRWLFDGFHPTNDSLVIKSVFRSEGDSFVYGGEGAACDFNNLQSYYE